jgi:hypothetical protein
MTVAGAQVSVHTLDSILERLGQFHQRATYGAVAGVVNTSPRSLMSGRERDGGSSWIVSRSDGRPTGYTPEQMHPMLEEREEIIASPEALRVWLESPV